MSETSTAKVQAGGADATGFVVFDADGRLVEADAWLFAHIPASRLAGRPCEEVVGALLADVERIDGAAVMPTGLTAADVARRWREATARPLTVELSGGRRRLWTANRRSGGGTVLVSVDITERGQKQAELEQARVMLRDAIESLSEDFALYDANSRLVLCNQRYREFHRANADVLVPGVTWKELMRTAVARGQYPDAIGREDEWIEEHDAMRRQYGRRHEYETADGRWMESVSTQTSQGGFVIVRCEITERKRLEKAKREREEQLRFVIENHPLPVTLTDEATGEIIYASPEGARLFGRDLESEAHIRITELYVDPAERAALLERLRRSGEARDVQVQLKRVDGQPFWALLNARLVDYQGRRVILAGLSDQTERIERERELYQARELLGDAIESLAEGFALYGADDRLVMCNRRYREMHALTADLLEPGIHWLDLLRGGAERGQFPVAAGRVEEWLEERRRDRLRFGQNYELQHADGRWYSVSNSRTRHGGTVVTRVDISERKQMEHEERERDALVRKVLDGCPVPIQMTRMDGTIVYRTPATCELFGEAQSALDYYVSAEDRVPFAERLRRDGKADDFEVRLRNAEGEPFWGLVSARLIDYDGEPVIVSNTLDLTERKAMDRELADQREALFQREKLSALGELLAGVAHELNNPLSIVVGQAQLLSDSACDEATAARAGKIGRAADRCARIVKTFLAMARQQPSELREVDINDVVASALDVAGYSLRSSGVHVKLKLQADLPRTLADGDQLNQVIINLLVNAQQALEGVDGERRVTVGTFHSEERNELVVKVSDSGCGIPSDLHKRIFEPFFTTKEIGAGTGIGLAFCHRIVERHGGAIAVGSAEGRGTVFTVRIPVFAPGTTLDEDLPCPVKRAPRQTVLVVDDEPGVAELLAEILTADGHAVTICGTAREALAQLKAKRFDAVLSDLKMPDMDGPALFAHLSETAPATIKRLAFVTGDTMSPEARAFLACSGRPYIEKPIRPQELRELLQSLSAKP